MYKKTFIERANHLLKTEIKNQNFTSYDLAGIQLNMIVNSHMCVSARVTLSLKFTLLPLELDVGLAMKCMFIRTVFDGPETFPTWALCWAQLRCLVQSFFPP